MTDAERKQWQLLRRGTLAGYRFRRQHPVAPYVLDFACLAAKLAGGQHAESRHDEVRDAFLQSKGWRVLRFWNPDILRQPAHVAATILAALGPLPNPPPAEPGVGI